MVSGYIGLIKGAIEEVEDRRAKMGAKEPKLMPSKAPGEKTKANISNNM